MILTLGSVTATTVLSQSLGDGIDDALPDQAFFGLRVALEIDHGEVQQLLSLLLHDLALADGDDEVLHDEVKDLAHSSVREEASELVEIERLRLLNEVKCCLINVFLLSSVQHVKKKAGLSCLVKGPNITVIIGC